MGPTDPGDDGLGKHPHNAPTYGPDGYLHPAPARARSGSPESTSTCTTFSLTSTMDGRVFREDGGRLYQAHNDEYALPADELEQECQGGRNYLAPIDQTLPNGGEGKRGLDIGVGTGAWVIEMAQEFPNAEWIGVDIAPVQRDTGIPDNLHFQQDDVTRGLGFPDSYFDVVHCRYIVLGVRNWAFVVSEFARVLKPGGLAVFVEAQFPWPVEGLSDEQGRALVPGYYKWVDYFTAAVEKRGFDPQAGKNITRLVERCGAFRNVSSTPGAMWLWAWGDDPHIQAGGKILEKDTRVMPATAKLFIQDACEIPDSLYDELARGFLEDIGRPGAHGAVPMTHTWAWKKETAPS
ncbi:hypothetical protein Q5752_004696 [Cryptotrichosporon argae]